jgi:hypothetical protein
MSDDSDTQRGTPRFPAKIQTMLSAGRLKEQRASDANIAAVWQKAVESAADAELTDMSIDGSLRAAYDAGHMAALALLAAHGLRPARGQGHHEMAFAGAAALGNPALDDLVPDSEEIRGLRSGSMYDPVIADAADQLSALEWMRRVLPPMQSAIVAANPALRGRLAKYP